MNGGNQVEPFLTASHPNPPDDFRDPAGTPGAAGYRWGALRPEALVCSNSALSFCTISGCWW
jgi:hypothetical protein